MIKPLALLTCLSVATASVAAQTPFAPRIRPPARVRTILFLGNSFTQGAHSPVRNYRANAVTDLNAAIAVAVEVGDGYGGVPALFKTFTEEARLNYAVSLETQGGKTLGFHWHERRQVVDRPWDVVVLQELSTLARDRPGDPTDYRTYAPQFAQLFARRNPRVEIELMATWSRADLVYRAGSPWSGKPINAMALELRAATNGVKALSPLFRSVLPVGEAWNRAFATGLADYNPYDGVSPGQVNLWTYDHYHASAYGYYLEALVVFGRVTGIDPTTLGPNERAADELGLDPRLVSALQRIARDQLNA